MSLQHRTILTIATFWADRLGLELCPKHTLEKLAQDEEMISSLSLERKRLEEKLKGAAIREKILIEEKETAIQTSQSWEMDYNLLLSDLPQLREIVKLKELVSFGLGVILSLAFFLGVG